jgi:hypothetical protein
MTAYIIKHTAQTFTNGFGKFVSCEAREGYVPAMTEAMAREYADRNERIDATVIQYDVTFAPITNQAEYDAFRREQLYSNVPTYSVD